MPASRYFPAWWGGSGGGGGGGGTVTTVSVTTANGVSGSVANPTTTPAITLTLGDVTPTSVTTVNGVTGTFVDIFKTSSGGGANFEKLRIDGGLTVATEFSVKVLNGGTGVARALSLYGGNGLWLEATAGNVTLNAASTLVLRASSATRMNLTSSSLAPQTDNALDLGGAGLQFKSMYLATSAILASTCTIGWNADTFLQRTATGVLSLQNGANAMRWDVYNTTGANAEFGSMWWTSNVLAIGTDKSGAGVARAISFMIGGTGKWQIDTSFNLVPLGGNYNIGASGQRCGSGYFSAGFAVGASGADFIITAEALNVLQFGTDSATPATQYVHGADGSGLNIAGGNLQIGGGRSTGSGVGGSTVIMASPASGSSSTPNTAVAVATFTGAGDVQFQKTVTAGGTTGAQTINKTTGSVNFAAAATTLVVTNSLVATTSIVIATVATADTTMKSVVAVAAAGSFTLTANAAATAETRVNFVVFN